MNYIYKYQIHFDECDPAGILFFANTWDICHRAYESFLLSLNSDWSFWFQNPEWIIPIISSKCDFQRPLLPGSNIELHLKITNLGNSSFTSLYQLKINELLYSECSIVHVFTDKKTFKKIPIPKEIRDLFSPFASN